MIDIAIRLDSIYLVNSISKDIKNEEFNALNDETHKLYNKICVLTTKFDNFYKKKNRHKSKSCS